MIGQCHSRGGPKRCRHQQGMTADGQVVAEKRSQQLGHIRVAGMRLINHKQTARERTSPQVSPLHPERGKQDLINRPYGRRRTQETARTLRGPAGTTSQFVIRVILPFNLESSDPACCGDAGLQITRDGEHSLSPSIRWQQSAHCHVHPTLQLLCRRAGRDREIESVHESRAPEGVEPQYGGLGLPRAGLALQHEQRTSERSLGHRSLQRTRLRIIEQVGECHGW